MKLQNNLYKFLFFTLVILGAGLALIHNKSNHVREHLNVIARQEISLVQESYKLEYELRKIQINVEKVRAFLESNLASGDQLNESFSVIFKDAQTETQKSMDKINEVVGSMKASIVSNGELATMARLGVNSFQEELATLSTLLEELNQEVEGAISSKEVLPLQDKFTKILEEIDFISSALRSDFELITGTSKRVIVNDAQDMGTIFMVMSVVSIAFLVGITLYVRRKIFKPLDDATKIANDVKRGRRKIFHGPETDDELGNFMESVRNMTFSLREFEHKLQFERDKAQFSEKSLFNFLKNLNHQVRTPLFVISGFIGELEEDKLTPKSKGLVTEVHKEVDRIHRVLDEVMNFLTLRVGNSKVEKNPIAVDDFKHFLYDEFYTKAIAKGIHFHVDMSNNLNDQKVIVTDQELLKRVTYEIVDNAIKNTASGGVDIHFNLDSESFTITVTDTGHGIAHNQIEKYFRGYGAAGEDNLNKGVGLGIGLLLVSKTMKNLGGKVVFKTAPEKGCEVQLVFNKELIHSYMEDDATASITPIVQEVSTKEALMNMGGLRVLVVDDDEESFFMLNEQLKNFMMVDYANNGKVAADKIKENDYDIVLMDLQMPVMDGIEATKLIREIERESGHAHVPIVALTGYAPEKDVKPSEASEFQAYCMKPIRKQDLVRTLYSLTLRNGQMAS